MTSLFVVGGCRSGKSRFALEQVMRHKPPYAFIATSEPGDDAEMLARVARHQAERGPDWHTILAPRDPAAAIHQAAHTHNAAVLDCVTLWLANLLPLYGDDAILDKARELADVLRRPPLPVAVVSNETGLGIVPGDALSRRFRDLQGETNQILAAASQDVVFCVCGIPQVIKGNVR